MKKHTIISNDPSKSFISTISEITATNNQSALVSTSKHKFTDSIDKDLHKCTVSVKNSVLNEMSRSTVYDNCQFPYYRSNRNNSNYPDAVLVKDVGVSCMLLNPNVSKLSIPETKTLVEHLKKEYNDLSDITNKITAYTKDILTHLSEKNQRKRQLLTNLIASKHAIASQYVDSKGNLCLKLRLVSNAETQCAVRQAVKNIESTLLKDKYGTMEQRSKRKSQITTRDRNMISTNETHIQAIPSQEHAEMNTSNSTLPSTSSIYNYLTMRRKKPPSESVKCKLTNFGNTRKHENPKRFNDDKSSKDYSKKTDSVIFTNWKEISKLSKSKKKNNICVTSNEPQRMVNTKSKSLREGYINYNMVNDIPDTKFHTVNIRITKRNKKHV
ncbi:uncharacterized protein LOC143431156 isoform X2 [Xylocopa sonorina]